jgi:hypothetical protein
MIYFGTLVGLISVRVNPRGAAISFTCQAHKRPVVPRFLSPNAPAAILESWRRLLPDKSGRIFLAKSVTAKTLLSLLASLSGWLGEARVPTSSSTSRYVPSCYCAEGKIASQNPRRAGETETIFRTGKTSSSYVGD